MGTEMVSLGLVPPSRTPSIIINTCAECKMLPFAFGGVSHPLGRDDSDDTRWKAVENQAVYFLGTLEMGKGG